MADARETKTQSFKQNEENGYIREQIVEKKRSPVRTCISVGLSCLAVCVVGGMAGASYALVNHWLNQEEEKNESLPSHTISYNAESGNHVEKEGDSLDETLYDSDRTDEEVTSTEGNELQTEEDVVLEEWIDAYLETKEYTINDVEKMESALHDVYRNIEKSIVNIEVSNNSKTNTETGNALSEISGIIVSITEDEMILLVDGNLFEENAVLTAYPNTYKEQVIEIRQRDSITGITALAMSLEYFLESDYKNMQAITIGNSKRVNVGDIVILAGNPSGIYGSMQYGCVTYVEKNISTIDGEIRLLWTDRIKVENSSGAMFNLDGELVGWIDTSSKNGTTLQKAIGITDLTNIIENLILGENTAYLGIKGCAVTENMTSEYGLPRGIYVTEVDSMSAAYQGGIQQGDVITQVNGTVITNLQGLQSAICSLKESDEVTIVIQRKGKDGYKERTFTLMLQGR